MSAGLWAHYHPGHQDINQIRGEIRFALIAVVVSLLATLCATAAIAERRRTTAWATVLVCWIGLLAGGTLYLNLIPRGQQVFDKYAGAQLFRVPWQYHPRGADSPSRSGFSVFLCLDSLLGTYDEACRGGSEVTVLPAESGLDSWDERIWQWKYELNRLAVLGTQSGYQISGDVDALYSRRVDSAGKLDCLVICERGECRRQVLIGEFVIDYHLPEPTFVEFNGAEQRPPASEADFRKWNGLDQKLGALVTGWAVR
jgi:hypothetical protein